MPLGLNERAWKQLENVRRDEFELKTSQQKLNCGTEVFDFGVNVRGGIDAGLRLAEICLAGLGRVSLTNGLLGDWNWPVICTWTDHPVAACLASQYAGWQLGYDNYFGMGSGPMRAAAAREDLFQEIGFTESPEHAVGVIESSQLPTDDVALDIAQKCGVPPENLALLVAPTASSAGTLQVVARSVETALHKMHELGYDVSNIECGFGVAPLPPVAANDLEGIGRTNDAVLYGANVSLWVTGEDSEIEAIGDRIPAEASPDYGRPFLEIFENAGRDFYKIDPHLFSPAEIMIQNLDTGRVFRYGKLNPDVLVESFQIVDPSETPEASA
ncbi:MAG: methenyltetrahydromethanopterin cyclohydrolase [Planctomycetaceae bacterium]|nr:methenyltetrahydromethanopterin cyclohydrolase [Planctomycetaceae bacterium]